MILADAKRQGVERRKISADEVVQRCLLALVNEGADILEEGIATRSSDIDLVYVNGYGFPAFRGGPMFWADAVGLRKILTDIEALHKKYGAHWKPSPLLQRLAANGGSFSTMSGKTSS
jgi:3-hydroxyacyl-CoA dehydrogenase